MTDKFDRYAGSKNTGDIPSDESSSSSGRWDEYLAEFRNEDDVEVRSLEDLGMDDDFLLTELQSHSDPQTEPSDPFVSAHGGADTFSGDFSGDTIYSGTEDTGSHDLDLSIFDELDEITAADSEEVSGPESETAASDRKGTPAADPFTSASPAPDRPDRKTIVIPAGGLASQNSQTKENGKNMGNETKQTKKKARKKKSGRGRRRISPLKVLLLLLLGLVLACVLAVAGYVGYVVVTSPEINPDNLYADLHQTSKIYDDSGALLEYVDSAEVRTNVTYDQLPQDLIDAFVAIEDKTFFEHNGFNYIRILGAIKESILTDSGISGTSTITQQLARNLYLTKERSMTRKIREAYYTVILERELTKEQILEAYLNTISLGYSAYGVQAAANSYFGCELSDLTLAQCATLASIPKSPAKYSPLKNLYNEDVSADNENILLVGDTFTTVYDDTFKDRQELVLWNMKDQERISEEEYQAAVAEDIKSSLHPTQDKQTVSSYFADYCLDEVREDLMEEYNLSEEDVEKTINRGIYIYSTLNLEMQKIAEQEFSNNANFPSVRNLRTDGDGNLLSSSGNILMYKRGTYFNADGSFSVRSGEFGYDAAGNLVLYKGNRLKFYTVKGSGDTTEEQIELKQIYFFKDNILYSINGGIINCIGAQYKSKDADGNLVISSEYINGPENKLIISEDAITVTPEHYTLRQETIQPQGSMVVTDIPTGQIKVMVGGRSLRGRLLYNRADNPRQPGSSMKPIGVYGPAIQSGVDLGTGWTAGSTIEDSPNYVNGKMWPKNSNNRYDGWITLRTCVEQSKNVPSVRLINNIGYEYSVDFLKKNGITSIVEEGDTNDLNPSALGLGGMTKGVSPIEMASAYATFPNKGVHVEPTTYTKVTDAQGNVLLESKLEETRVFDESVAFIMTDILRTTVTNGIAGRAYIGVAPVGGKTGTTNDNYDAWFVGFTPQYAASVWIGNDVNIELTQGSSAAASLWSRVMRQLAPFGETKSFPEQPADVYRSGGEYYVDGTQRTGPAVGPIEKEEEEPEVLTDENGSYIIDSAGQKVYVTVDPDTGKVTPIDTPTTDPDNPPTDQPVTPPTDQPVTPPTDQPVTPPTDQPVTPPTDQPVTPPTDQPVTPPADEPVTPPGVVDD